MKRMLLTKRNCFEDRTSHESERANSSTVNLIRYFVYSLLSFGNYKKYCCSETEKERHELRAQFYIEGKKCKQNGKYCDAYMVAEGA